MSSSKKRGRSSVPFERYDDDDDDDIDSLPPNGTRRHPDLYANGGSPMMDEHDPDEEPSAPEIYLSQTDNFNPNTPLRQEGKAAGSHLKHPKSVQDRVHGQITLHGLLVAVMDTIEFQRLDRVKQLGGCAFVYPSATHSRKEHSIGVAYLAGTQVKHLAKHQEDLNIDESDVLCVELAGLVHDLGHGPFSHMFEEFMHKVTPEGEPQWEHEEMSGRLLRLLIRENDIPVHEYFPECSVKRAEEHINFVVKLIEGLKDTDPWPDDVGRGAEKRFLFDIVSNKRNGIDVDKLDYLVRDSMAAFGSSKPPGFDINRIITSSKVAFRRAQNGAGPPSKLEPEVVYQMKNALEILEVYSLRAKLHRQVYQHRIANVAEAMITDVFLAANKFFHMRGASQGDAEVRLDQAARDPRTFVRLNDSIIDAIDLYQPRSPAEAEGLRTAWRLLERIKRRDFYRQVGEDPINIETLPLCAKCRKGTAIEAKFCSRCGHPTATRRASGTTGKLGEFKTDGQLMTEEKARKEILELISPHIRAELERCDALLVKIVDIQNGKATTKEDPQKLRWSVYDPLAGVGFFNPKQADAESGGGGGGIERIDQERVPKIYIPAASHTKTLWCYLRVEGEGGDPSIKYGDDWRPEIQAALNKWKERGGFTNQTGTSNTASPAVMRGSQPTPKHVPSVAKRTSNLAPRGLDRAGGGLGPIAEPQRRGTAS